MAYELRLDGQPLGRFDTQESALREVRRLLADHPDREPEIIDLDSGRPLAPGATGTDREELAKKIGY